MPLDGAPLRWRFPHPSEDEARQQVLGKIDAWWEAFAAERERLAALVPHAVGEVAAFMQRHLGAIDPALAWELGPEPGDQAPHVLVVTAENRARLRPLVDVDPLPGPAAAGVGAAWPPSTEADSSWSGPPCAGGWGWS